MKVFEINGKKYVYADVEAKEMFAVYYEDKIDYKTLIPVDELSKIDEEDMDMLRDENGEIFTANVGLFDGAEFGDKYKTRGGDIAIYTLTYGSDTRNKCVKLMVKLTCRDGIERIVEIIVDSVTGKRIYVEETEMDRFDIVSRWED